VIYVLQAPDGGPLKIGFSDDVPARIRQLESHYRRPLALLATMDGGREEERAIHERFAEHRLGRTEQFKPVAEIMAFIGRPLLVSAAPDTVEAMPGSYGPSTNVRSGAAWKEWLEQLAEHDADARRADANISETIDRALVLYAREIGFTKVAPKR
jgi:hypothetical protein